MTDFEISAARKAAVFDLLMIFTEDPANSYTVEEIRKIMMAYVSGKENREG